MSSSDKENQTTTSQNQIENITNNNGNIENISTNDGCSNNSSLKSLITTTTTSTTNQNTNDTAISSSSNNSNNIYDDDQFDFTKTGAKPKTFTTNNLNYNGNNTSKKKSSSSKSSKVQSASTITSIQSSSYNEMEIDDDSSFYNAISDISNETRSQFKSLNEENEILNDFTQIVECPLCGRIVKNDLEKHIQIEHREYECPFCNLLYDSESLLKEHIDSVHECDDSEGVGDYGGKSNKNFEIGVFDVNSVKDTSAAVAFKNEIFDEKREKMLKETFDSSNEDQKSFICPVCNIRIQDQTWLELHVDSHFNNNSNQDVQDLYDGAGAGAAAACSLPYNSSCDLDEAIGFASSIKRTNSASSLTANVDENFYIDQAMTLDNCDFTAFSENDKSNISEKENACGLSDSAEIMCENDYQIAVELQNQEKENDCDTNQLLLEKERSPLKSMAKMNDDDDYDESLSKIEQINEDHMGAQLLERKDLETLKYDNYKKENNNNKNKKFYNNYDPNMTPEEELEWLKRKYGMGDMDRETKAQMNLERAFKQKRIDVNRYNEEKEMLNNQLNSIYDNGKTYSPDVVSVMKTMTISKWMQRRYLCTYCDHYGTGIIDGGYGCGYRNTQMMMSSIRSDPALKDVIFNNNNTSMPSINKLQKLVENAWSLGFDQIGKEQFNGQLHNTAKWIGASDVATLFLSLKLRVELVDINEPKNGESIALALANYVKSYFESAKGHVHPIFLQHQGHSRTIVGLEIGKDGNMNLIIFDPGSRVEQIDEFRQTPYKLMYLFRRGLHTFKHKQYQLLILRGFIDNDLEYENSKKLVSTRIV